MQLKNTILYGAIITLSVTVVGMYSFQSFNLGESQTSSVNSESSFITGHVTMFVTAPDGKIVTYRQSDNIIVNQGADCANKALFAPTSGITTTCSGSPGTFDVIALGTGVNGNTRTDTALTTETSATGLARAVASTVNATAAPSGGTSTVSISNTFTNTSGGAVTISEAGLFNSTNNTIDGMFAEEPISPSIALNNNDALTVKWTISLTN
ncbi:MAG: hypothetical protein ACYDAJ_11760 [Nitrosotalea sp.]